VRAPSLVAVSPKKRPLITPAAQAAHDRAESRGLSGYVDPDSGLFVMTATYLRDRGYCCNSGCRHCPYED